MTSPDPEQRPGEDLPPDVLEAIRESIADIQEHGGIALPQFPDQPGKWRVRFSKQAALEFLDLMEAEEDQEGS